MRRVVAVVLLAAGVLSAAACTAGGGSDGGAATGGAGGDAVGRALLADLVVTRNDLRPGETMTSPPDARKLVTGSLGYCAMPFPSEDLRTARHQVTLEDRSGEWSGVEEAVRYEPGGAFKAVGDMRAAFIDCPDDEFIVPPAADGSTDPDAEAHRYDAFPLVEDDLPDVASDHVAARVTFTTRGGEISKRFIVVQRRGNVAIVSIAPDEDRVLEMANASGRRLAAASGSSLGE